jgi:hypothetical protein
MASQHYYETEQVHMLRIPNLRSSVRTKKAVIHLSVLFFNHMYINQYIALGNYLRRKALLLIPLPLHLNLLPLMNHYFR